MSDDEGKMNILGLGEGKEVRGADSYSSRLDDIIKAISRAPADIFQQQMDQGVPAVADYLQGSGLWGVMDGVAQNAATLEKALQDAATLENTLRDAAANTQLLIPGQTEAAAGLSLLNLVDNYVVAPHEVNRIEYGLNTWDRPPSSLIIPPTMPDLGPKPPPGEGKLVTAFEVLNAKRDEITDILDVEFKQWVRPLCYLVGHADAPGYWYIHVFTGDEALAKELLSHWYPTPNNEKWAQSHLKWLEMQVSVGYVYVGNRKRIPIRFYLYDEAYTNQVQTLARAIANELHRNSYLVQREGNSLALPEGAECFEDVKPFLILDMVDRVESWLKGFLQSEGHTAVSVQIRQEVGEDDQIYIQYALWDCLIQIRTKTIIPLETRVKPVFMSWFNNEMERGKAVNAAAAHLRAVVQGMKNDLRWKPLKPATTDNLDEWFDYLHECEEAKIPYSLKVLAVDVHRDYGYIRQLHSRYMAERRY